MTQTPDGVGSDLPEMPCQELVEVLTDHEEGVLSPRDRRRLELHLAQCPACRRYLDQLRTTIALLARRSVPAVPSRTIEAVLAAFRDRA